MPVIFQKWEELVTKGLNPARINSLSGEEISDIIRQSEAERDCVTKQLMEGIFDRTNIRDKQQFVQVHQAMLIRLLNKVFAYQQTGSGNDKAIPVYQSINRHLEHALNFIEDFFSNYFDRTERVPASYFFVATGELCRQMVLLKEKLEAGTEIDATLAVILKNNFNSYCNGEKTSATYKDLVYQRELMKELLADKTLATEASVREVLFYFNFNNDDFVAYLYRRFAALTEDLPTRRDKVAALRYEQKIINQLRTKLNTVFNEGMPALKEQVSQWIEEEIKFLEAAPATETKSKTEAEPEDKIQTSLSVAKLALLLRLMVIEKIITNRVVAQVLRIVVRTVATLQTEDISFGSLETKYHNPDRGTIKAVKDMLFKWLNILNKL